MRLLTSVRKSGTPVAHLNIATNERWTDQQSGERKERTEWHRIVVWGKQAEILNEYLRKGRSVYVEGSLQTREWTDTEGNKRYTTEVRARSVQMLGPRDEQKAVEVQALEAAAAQPATPSNDEVPF